MAVAEAPVGVVEGVAADLVVEVGADHARVVAVAAGQEHPVVGPLGGGAAAVPALVAVEAAAPAGGDGVVVEDDGEAAVGQRRDDGVVDLERGLPAQRRIGGDGTVRDGGGGAEHLVGEGQPDAVEAEGAEVGEQGGQGHPVQAERDTGGVLAGMVVRGIGAVAGAGPGALGAVPVAGAQAEAVAVRVDDPAASGGQRRGPALHPGGEPVGADIPGCGRGGPGCRGGRADRRGRRGRRRHRRKGDRCRQQQE